MKWAYFRFMSLEFYGEIRERGSAGGLWDIAKAKRSVEIWLGNIYVSFSLANSSTKG